LRKGFKSEHVCTEHLTISSKHLFFFNKSIYTEQSTISPKHLFENFFDQTEEIRTLFSSVRWSLQEFWPKKNPLYDLTLWYIRIHVFSLFKHYESTFSFQIPIAYEGFFFGQNCLAPTSNWRESHVWSKHLLVTISPKTSFFF